MDQDEFEQQAAKLRKKIAKGQAKLVALVNDACPGPHDPRQHRDAKPPWCSECGRSNLGISHKKELTASLATQDPE